MNFTFSISSSNIHEFVKHWSPKYVYSDHDKYLNNIGKPLTSSSRRNLFEWKNGGVISKLKLKSISENYPLKFPENMEERYLNHKLGGGAIWNIFYLHCFSPKIYPIFDQHNYRAMIYLKTGKIKEIPNSDKIKYELYKNEFIPFFYSLKNIDHRELDKALFSFGKFLKTAKSYI